MLFLLNRLFDGRHGPLIRAGLGVALVAIGLLASAKILLLLGGVFVVWGLASEIGSLSRHRRRPAGAAGGPLGEGGDGRPRAGR